MKSKRIMIIGCSGSGKTTLATKLGSKINVQVIHLDKLFWRAGWKSVSDEEFDILLQNEITKDSWIIDGNFNRTIKYRLDHCDTVIYLDFYRLTCLIGVIKRVLSNYGKTRFDMGENCPEKFDLHFLKWIWNYNKVYRDKYYKLLEGFKNKNVIIIKNRKECQSLLDKF